jgi:hypothetical protein
MSKSAKITLKMILLLFILIAGSNAFPQKALFSVYNNIPDFTQPQITEMDAAKMKVRKNEKSEILNNKPDKQYPSHELYQEEYKSTPFEWNYFRMQYPVSFKRKYLKSYYQENKKAKNNYLKFRT